MSTCPDTNSDPAVGGNVDTVVSQNQIRRYVEHQGPVDLDVLYDRFDDERRVLDQLQRLIDTGTLMVTHDRQIDRLRL